MSDVAIPPVTQQPVSTRQDAVPDSVPPKSAASPPEPATPPSVDTVSLSPAAQTPTPGQTSAETLSESDAADQSAALRQQLPKFNLSGTAKQNQSILALLRCSRVSPTPRLARGCPESDQQSSGSAMLDLPVTGMYQAASFGMGV